MTNFIRMKVVFVGQVLGSASGWDADPGEWTTYYDFQPHADTPLCACASLEVNETEAMIKAWDEAGTTVLRAWSITYQIRPV